MIIRILLSFFTGVIIHHFWIWNHLDVLEHIVSKQNHNYQNVTIKFQHICISTFWLSDIGGVETWIKEINKLVPIDAIYVYEGRRKFKKFLQRLDINILNTPSELNYCSTIFHINSHSISSDSINFIHGDNHIKSEFIKEVSVNPLKTDWIPVPIRFERFTYSLSDYLSLYGFNNVKPLLYVTRISPEKNLNYFSILCEMILCALIGSNDNNFPMIVYNTICLSDTNLLYKIFLCGGGLYTSKREGGPIQLIQSLMFSKPFYMFETGLSQFASGQLSGVVENDLITISSMNNTRIDDYWQHFSISDIRRKLQILIPKMLKIEFVGADKVTIDDIKVCFVTYDKSVIKINGLNVKVFNFSGSVDIIRNTDTYVISKNNYICIM